MNELKNGHVKTVADTVTGNPIQFRLASRRTYIYINDKTAMLLEKTNRVLYLFSSTKRSSACTFSSRFFCSPLFFVIILSLSEFMHLNLNLLFFLPLSSDTYISPSCTFPSLLFFILHSTHTNHIVFFLFVVQILALRFQISSTPLFPVLTKSQSQNRESYISTLFSLPN